MPARIHTATWIVLAIGYAYSGATKLGNPSWIDGSALLQALSDPLSGRTLLGELVLLLPPSLISLATWSVLALEISFVPLAILRRARPWLWLALLGMQLFLITLGHFADSSAGMLMLHFLAFDPAWVKGKEGCAATIFYDGGCGLCHRFVRFALAEDREGRDFRFAPLEGNVFAAIRNESDRAETLDQIDSIVLSLSDGNLFVRAAAMLGIGEAAGRPMARGRNHSRRTAFALARCRLRRNRKNPPQTLRSAPRCLSSPAPAPPRPLRSPLTPPPTDPTCWFVGQAARYGVLLGPSELDLRSARG